MVVDALRAGDRIVGTPLYMAPEQAQSLPAEPAADWYSVGVILYEALTGRPPFDGSAVDVLKQKLEKDPLYGCE